MVLVSLAVRYKLHMKQLDVETALLNSLLEHEVQIPAYYNHPAGHTIALLHKSLHGLKHAASDWHALQHVRLMICYPYLLRSVADPCFYYKVQDGGHFFFLVQVDDYDDIFKPFLFR